MRLVVDSSDHAWEAWVLGGRSKDRFGYCTVTFSSPMHGLRKGKLKGSFDDATDEELRNCLESAEPQR
jgi:hypothetical protein